MMLDQLKVLPALSFAEKRILKTVHFPLEDFEMVSLARRLNSGGGEDLEDVWKTHSRMLMASALLNFELMSLGIFHKSKGPLRCFHSCVHASVSLVSFRERILIGEDGRSIKKT